MPEPDFSSVPATRLSTWEHTSKVRQDFWSRWSLEYLNELQIRRKWKGNQRRPDRAHQREKSPMHTVGFGQSPRNPLRPR